MGCNTCWAWCPTKWDSWHWADEEAQCKVHGTSVRHDHMCTAHAMLKPSTFAARVPSTEEQLEQWYDEHFIEFETTDETHVEGTLFKHQIETVERFKDEVEGNLFHEAGCGKSATLLNIVAHKYRKGECDALIVVAPNDVHRQWTVEQIPQWLPQDIEREVQCFGGRGGAKQLLKFYKPEALQIVCVNIDTFSTPIKWKPLVQWHNERKCIIALDEATTIKNVKAKRTERMLYAFNDVMRNGKRILASRPKSVARYVLTGTPVTNGPMDLWSMMEFVHPNFFGRNWYSFQNHFGMFTTIHVTDTQGNRRRVSVKLNEDTWHEIKAITSYSEAYSKYEVSEDTFNWIHRQEKYEGPYKNADELKKLIAPVSSFKRLVDCTDMPKQLYDKRLLTMSDEQAACYVSMENELLAIYRDKLATAANKVTAAIRLQQISSGFLSTKATELGPDLELLPNDITWIGKSNPKLDCLYEDVDSSELPVIVLTRFVAEADRIFNELKAKGYRVCLMTGWKKVGTIDEFKEGKYDVMVANTRVVSKGFNLQNSHTILFYSNTFSLEDRLQAEGRIFRLGQRQPCKYIDYVYLDTIDMKVVAALHQKRGLLEYIRNTDLTDMLTKQDEVFQIEYSGYDFTGGAK